MNLRLIFACKHNYLILYNCEVNHICVYMALRPFGNLRCYINALKLLDELQVKHTILLLTFISFLTIF